VTQHHHDLVTINGYIKGFSCLYNEVFGQLGRVTSAIDCLGLDLALAIPGRRRHRE
jgi:hypothetical protein